MISRQDNKGEIQETTSKATIFHTQFVILISPANGPSRALQEFPKNLPFENSRIYRFPMVRCTKIFGFLKKFSSKVSKVFHLKVLESD